MVGRREEVSGHEEQPGAVGSAKHKEIWKATLRDRDCSSVLNTGG